jgi:NADH-quinone oxidoreductase subunit H
MSVLFFGGWHFPLIAEASHNYAFSWVPKVLVLLFKVSCFIVLIQLIRWTIPRFRFDQLMGLAWKVLIPLATANVLLVMCVLEFGFDRLWLLPLSIALFAAAGLIGTQATLPRSATGSRNPAAPVLAKSH